jgi:ubiquinone/menaquinone biosynthesis C-methylase UbiE
MTGLGNLNCQDFEHIEHLPGVLFANFGPREARNGEFPQKLEFRWAHFEHYWQFCSAIHLTQRQATSELPAILSKTSTSITVRRPMKSAVSSTEAFLRSFHNQYPGLTAKAFGGLQVTMQGSAYPSTYHLLIDTLPSSLPNSSVLEVGCGDGFLLSLLADLPDSATTLTGIDLSEAELQQASLRLGPRAFLCQGRAQAMPFASGAFTHVLCHMALMLMDDAPGVVREIRRVLVSTGIFAAVVGARSPGSPAMDAFRAIVSRYPRRPEYADVQFGDKRTRSAQGLQELLAQGFTDISIQDLSATKILTKMQFWNWLIDMYDVHLLSEDDIRAARDEYFESLGPMAELDGTLSHIISLRLFVATAA